MNSLTDQLNAAELESYIDCTGKRCYRARGEGAAMRHANYEAKRLETLRHYRFVEEEARRWRGEQ